MSDLERIRENDRRRYYRDKEKRLLAMREWVEKNRERSNEIKKAWAARNYKKRQAQWAVNNAIRDGRMERGVCEVCGDNAQAHHHDYERPLDVQWLCSAHHGERHRTYS